MKRAEILERVNVARRKLDAVQRATSGTYAAAIIRDTLRGELEAIPAPDRDRGRWAWVLPPLVAGAIAGAVLYGLAVLTLWWLAAGP